MCVRYIFKSLRKGNKFVERFYQSHPVFLELVAQVNDVLGAAGVPYVQAQLDVNYTYVRKHCMK